MPVRRASNSRFSRAQPTGSLARRAHGEVEGIGLRPHLRRRSDANGRSADRPGNRPTARTTPAPSRPSTNGSQRIIGSEAGFAASAIASSMAASTYAAPVADRRQGPCRTRSADPARAAAPAAQSRRDPRHRRRRAKRAAGCLLRHRVSPTASRRSRRNSPCRATSRPRAYAATASTVYPTNTSSRLLPHDRARMRRRQAGRRPSRQRRQHVRHRAAAAASPRTMGLPPSKACPWARAAARSIPASSSICCSTRAWSAACDRAPDL